VTRSVANHLNDIAKTAPDGCWAVWPIGRHVVCRNAGELAWMTKHALRTLIKQGHPGAMIALGYDPDAPVEVTAFRRRSRDAPASEGRRAGRGRPDRARDCPVLVDYIIWFKRPAARKRQGAQAEDRDRPTAGET
jgi:hypothetical protein